jgi:hypothetical protein
MSDLKFAFRQLLKNPGFTAVAVLTLAICLGGSLAIFAVVDAVLVRPLPFPDADRLVVIHNSYPGAGIERGNASVSPIISSGAKPLRRSNPCRCSPRFLTSSVRQVLRAAWRRRE